MSYEDYLVMIDDSTHSEWVDGEVTIFMPPDLFPRHFIFLASLINLSATEAFGLGESFIAPFEMKLRKVARIESPT